MRPLPAPTLIRVDTSLAMHEDAAAARGLTVATVVTGAVRVPNTGPATAGLGLVLRSAVVGDTPPRGPGGVAVVNPLLGVAYAVVTKPGFRFNAFLGNTLPVGMGGGDAPARGPAHARAKGPNARSQLENTLFGTNDVGIIPGIGAGWVAHGWTLQLEATLFHSIRARGSHVQPEASKTNSALGFHVGYFVLPYLSLNGEVRYQRWLNAPIAVDRDTSRASVDTMTMALGPRAHVRLPGVGYLRPGLAYARGLDKPMAAAAPNYHIVQVDLPLFF